MERLTVFGHSLTLPAAAASTGMRPFPERWRRPKPWAHGGARWPL